MSEKAQLNQHSKSDRRQQQRPAEEPAGEREQERQDPALVQRARSAPQSLTPRDVLQLQRTIGNRAVGQLLSRKAQPAGESSPRAAAGAPPLPRPTPGEGNVIRRLVFTQQDKKLHVPKDYGDQKLPWNAEGKHLEERAPNDQDSTLEHIYKHNSDALNKHMTAGIGAGVESMQVREWTDTDAKTLLLGLIAESATGKKAIAAALGEAFRAHNKVLVNFPYTTYWGVDEVKGATKWAMLPKDYIPEAPDLPAAGTDLQSKISKDVLSEKWYSYACVLIALLKQQSGYDQAAALTGQAFTGKSMHQAVQQLHDYYKGHNVEYDDSSSRSTVMTAWGYQLIFSGPISFTDLRKHIALKQGRKYIFDITGHTVKVTLLQDVPLDNQVMTGAQVKQYLQFHSEADNYNKDETSQNLLYIFAKD